MRDACAGASLDMSRSRLRLPAFSFSFSRGFSKVGNGKLQAIDLLHRKGMHVSKDKMHGLLTRCSEAGDVGYQRQVHALMVSTGLDDSGILGDHLIRLFAASGSLLEGTLAFCKVLHPSVHTWHAIICAHISLGESAKVFHLYQTMQQENLQPNKFIYSCILKACASIPDLAQGKAVHEHMLRSEAEVDVIMGSALLDMYVKCGDLATASEIFNGMPKNIVYYNIMLAGLVEQKRNSCAFELFHEIMWQGFELSVVTFLCILKACSSLESLSQGRVIHDLCAKAGVEFDKSVGCALIDMYSKCKSLEDASSMFEGLPAKNLVSWNALISGCSQLGCEHAAFEYFVRMQKSDIKPDEITFSSIISACGNIKAVRQGDLIHDQLMRSDLRLDAVVGNTLVDMYGKCGRLEDAHNVFDRLLIKNAVTWNTLITAYVQHGMDHIAVKLFESMHRQGFKANIITLSCTLSACSSLNDLGRGRALHEHAIRNDWSHDLLVGNALVDLYTKCGSLEDALKVFDGLPLKNVISWNTLIAGQVLNMQSPYAINLFCEMLKDKVDPNEVSLLCLLKYCGNLGYISQGMMLHVWLVNTELQMDVSLGNMLLDMYIKCGCLHEARNVFDSMKSRDVVSWGSIITGSAQHKYNSCAINLFFEMQKAGFEPNTILLSCVLRACGNIKDIHHGRLIHVEIVFKNLDSVTYVANSLVDMYAKCKNLESAYAVFNKLSARDLVSWNSMIAGYAQEGLNHRALEVFIDLQQEDLLPDEITFASSLNVCTCTELLGQGRLIHGQVFESNYYSDPVIGNTLVNMYCKSGALDDAKLVLDQLNLHDVVAWNTMMAGYIEHGCGAFAFKLYKKMLDRNVCPDKVTFLCLFKACSSTPSLQHANTIHEKVVESKVFIDSVVGNSIVDTYITCGDLEAAMGVFANLHHRDTVSFNTMISGCLEHEQGFSALQFFEKMHHDGIKPDKITFLSAIKASGSIGAVRHGNWMHDQVLRQGFDSDLAIGNTLISMYSLCGWLAEANHSFATLSERNMVSWSALVAGYSQHGYFLQAAQFLEEMQQQGLKPGDMIFTSILSACSHEGMVEEGHGFFDFMKEHCCIEPSIEHYNSMLQLLGCSGHLREAESMLQTIPIAADTCSWMTLLIACRSFGDRRWENCA